MAKANQKIRFNGSFTSGSTTFGDHSPSTGSVAIGAAEPQPGDVTAERSNTTLIIVAAQVEFEAFTRQVLAVNGAKRTVRHLTQHSVHELGRIGGTNIVLAHTDQGVTTPFSAGPAAPALIEELRPARLVLAGICYGLRDDATPPQRYGDVVVATQLRLTAHTRVTQDDDGVEPSFRKRGGEVHPSPVLVDRFRAASRDWSSDATVWFGPVISEGTLVDSKLYRERLRKSEPDAIAGEMEGAAIYTAAMRAKVDWCLVKAICDWGYGKGDTHQRAAAENAASLVVHAIGAGGFDRVG